MNDSLTFLKIPRVLSLFLILITPSNLAFAQSTADDGNQTKPRKSPLAEEWTASVLPAGKFAVGSMLELGLGQGFMIGSDPAATSLGAKTLQAKWQLPSFGEDDWSLGLKVASLNRRSIWWGDVSKRFSKLDAKMLRPSIAWSNRISSALIIHSFWTSGIGKTSAELSEVGKAKLKESKYGTNTPGDGHSFANRTMQVQSLAGFTEDRFQMTAEWERTSGERVLLSTRFERTRLEQLETFSVRITLAQHWSTDGFNLRLGAGPQYAVLSGKDLDDEELDASGWLPTADFAIYWVL